MHYFTYGLDLAAVEDDARATLYEAAGWERVGRAAFMAAWRARDIQRLSELWPAEQPKRTKMVGGVERPMWW